MNEGKCLVWLGSPTPLHKAIGLVHAGAIKANDGARRGLKACKVLADG
jgi:hypothetical protein